MSENNPADQAKLLLEKYLRGECTPEEEAQVQDWFYSFGDEPLEEEHLVQALGNTKDTIMDYVSNDVPVTPIATFFPWKKIAVAALLLIFLGGVIGGYLHTTKSDVSLELAAIVGDSTGVYKNDIMPGSTYAYVVYPDGQKRNIDHDAKLLGNTTNVSGGGLLTVGVPKAGKYKLELKDGTLVWLNSSSTLSFPETFANDERKVELNGEAYFEVAKDAKRPFRIAVKGSTIEVLGTSFNVNAYTDEVNTSLVEGKVKIINDDIEKYLIPGEEALIKGDEIKIATTNLPKNTAWQRDEFYFDGSNLQDIIQQLARWYDVDFINSELLTGATTYKGSMSRDLRLSAVLSMLTIATQRKFEINGREVTVK